MNNMLWRLGLLAGRIIVRTDTMHRVCISCIVIVSSIMIVIIDANILINDCVYYDCCY